MPQLILTVRPVTVESRKPLHGWWSQMSPKSRPGWRGELMKQGFAPDTCFTSVRRAR